MGSSNQGSAEKKELHIKDKLKGHHFELGYGNQYGYDKHMPMS